MGDRGLLQGLSAAEREAVEEAARRMRAFHERTARRKGKSQVTHQTGGAGCHNGTSPPRPDQTIADLADAGTIDRRREAQLTALALRVSRGETRMETSGINHNDETGRDHVRKGGRP